MVQKPDSNMGEMRGLIKDFAYSLAIVGGG